MKKSILFTIMMIITLFITGQEINTVNISYVMNKSNPPSYTFTTDFKGEALKYYWYFGDLTSSEDAIPTHFFKITGTYVIVLKILDKSQKVHYGKLEARFEGGTSLTLPCQALFIASVSSASSESKGKKVTFLNSSVGDVKEYAWSFGDGRTSNEKNPVHEYTAYGEYKVCLVITTAGGCKSDHCITLKLNDPAIPVIVPGKGYVKNLSLENCGLVIVLSEGTVLLPVQIVPPFVLSAGQNIEIAYELLQNVATTCQTGKPVKIHKIALIGQNTACKASFSFTNYKTSSGEKAPKKLVFTNTSTGNITSCNWTFGDGYTNTDKNPVHEYASYGEYRVCLVIGTASGCTSDYCTTIKLTQPVDPAACKASFTFANVKTASGEKIPKKLAFTNTSTGNITSSKWNFGDGTTSTDKNPSHEYAAYGEYRVCLVIGTASGCTSDVCTTIKLTPPVDPAACKASFTYADVKTASGEKVPKKLAFTNTSTGNVTSSKWNFGDGTTSTDKNPPHEYAAYGEYRVCLVIGTASGCTSDVCTTVKLTPPVDPTACKASFTFANAKTASGETAPKKIAFTNTSAGNITSSKWNFGDGTTSTDKNPSHEYAAYGEHKVCLVVGTASGCTSEYCTYVKVTEPGTGCKAYFTATNELWSDIAMMKKMVFSNQSTGTLKECTWSFGDGTSGSELRPVHEYPAFGTYKVCLSILTTNGCRSEYCTEVKVQGGTVTPTCNFDLVVKQKEQAISTYLFYAISNVVIKSWKWSFGDGKTSDLQNPEHTYEKAGSYEVTCTVVTERGCTATRTKKITVSEPVLPVCPGAINLMLYDPTGTITLCNGKAVVQLINEKGEPYSGVTYTWSNGATGQTAEMLCPNKLYSVHAVVDKVCQKNSSFAFLSAPAWKFLNSKNMFSFSVETPSEDILYKWDFGDGNSAFGTAVDYTYNAIGDFTVTLTAISGSYSNESTKKVAVISGVTAVSDDPFAGFKVFPNPVRDYLRIVPGNSVSGNLIVEMIDLKGQKVYSGQFGVNNQHIVEVNVGNLREGIYLLHMKSDNQIFPVMKVVKAL